MKNFSTAKMDKMTLFYTLFFLTLLLTFFVLSFLQRNETDLRFAFLPISTVLLIAIVSSYLMIPKLAVDKTQIIIKNYFTTIKVPFSGIANIERFHKIGFNFRTFGVGGLFGYFGYLNGNDVWYVTNVKKKVKITMKSGKKYLISPEFPDEFVDFVHETMN